MFVRRKTNRSGSVSVQVIDKSNGYRVVKTIGSARDPEEVARLTALGELFIKRQSGQYDLFPEPQHDNAVILDFVQTLDNASIRTAGPNEPRSAPTTSKATPSSTPQRGFLPASGSTKPTTSTAA